MSCSPFDLRDYFLKELPEPDRRQMEIHVKGCSVCREELDRLVITGAALFSLRDEEIPQRIAFVSDKIFEPSPVRRWWAGFWGSAPRLGFASAAVLSAAILVFSIMRTAPAPAPQANAPIYQNGAQTSPVALQPEIDRRINEAVAKAVTESEARQARKTAELMAAFEKRSALDRQGLMMAMDKNFEYMGKKLSRYTVASNGYDSPRLNPVINSTAPNNAGVPK